MLMVIYEIDAAVFFDLLKSWSRQTNFKLRPLAEQIAAEFLSLNPAASPNRSRRRPADGLSAGGRPPVTHSMTDRLSGLQTRVSFGALVSGSGTTGLRTSVSTATVHGPSSRCRPTR
jgi:hypothetical protein